MKTEEAEPLDSYMLFESMDLKLMLLSSLKSPIYPSTEQNSQKLLSLIPRRYSSNLSSGTMMPLSQP